MAAPVDVPPNPPLLPTGPASTGSPVAGDRGRRLRGRAATIVVLVDQALSSATNALMTIVAARSLAPSSFGLVTIGFGVYVIALGLTRAVTGETLLVLLPRHERGRTWTSEDPLGASLVSGAALSVVMLVGAGVVGGSLGWILVELAVGLPLLMLVDTYRYLFAARGQPGKAVVVDASWAVGMLVVLVGVHTIGGSLTGSVVFGSWVATGMLASAVGMIQHASVPSLSGARRFFAGTRHLSNRFAADFLLSSLGAQLTILVLAAFLPAAEIGALNGAQLLIAIPTMLFSAMVVVAVADWSQHTDADAATLRRRSLRLGSALGLVGALWAGVLLLDPGGLGRSMLGATWPTARTLMIPFGVVIALRGFAVGGNAGLRALGDGTSILRARLCAAPAAFLLAVAGACWSGATGAAYGLAVGSVVWVAMLHRSLPDGSGNRRATSSSSRIRTP